MPMSQENPGNMPRRMRLSQSWMTLSSADSSTRWFWARSSKPDADLPCAQAQAAEHQLRHGDPFALAQRSGQAPIENGEAAIGSHKEVAGMGVGMKDCLARRRPDGAGDHGFHDQFGEPPPVLEVVLPLFGHLVAVDSLHSRDSAGTERVQPWNQDLRLAGVGFRGLLQVPLFILEVDLGCQLFTHLIEDLAIRKLGNPERDAAVVEKPSDVLQQVKLQRQPVLDAGLEDLEDPAPGKIVLTTRGVSKRYHDGYASLGQRRGSSLTPRLSRGPSSRVRVCSIEPSGVTGGSDSRR